MIVQQTNGTWRDHFRQIDFWTFDFWWLGQWWRHIAVRVIGEANEHSADDRHGTFSN